MIKEEKRPDVKAKEKMNMTGKEEHDGNGKNKQRERSWFVGSVLRPCHPPYLTTSTL